MRDQGKRQVGLAEKGWGEQKVMAAEKKEKWQRNQELQEK